MRKQNYSNSPLRTIFKVLVVKLFKLLAIAVAFTFRVSAIVLSKISELLEKATGNGNNY